MATTTPRPKARERLIEAAHGLMLSKGFPATRVDEICELAGVSKGSFYHSFKTKEELGVAVLEEYYRRTVKRLVTGPYQDLEDPVKRAYGFLDFMEQIGPGMWSDGCLLGGFAMELADTNPTVQSRVSELFARMGKGLAVVFEPFSREAKKDLRLPSAREIADHFLMVIEGSVVLAKAHGDPERVAEGLRRFRDYLEGLEG